MQVATLNVTSAEAQAAVVEYKQHRNIYDKRDWEIERIYRAIARGKTVINAIDAIRRAGLDSRGLPKLALMRADQLACRCELYEPDRVILTNEHRSRASEWHFSIHWPNRPNGTLWNARALLPRIPPQHRPAQGTLPQYHLLWEADWQEAPPRDPYLLKRIGKDAWIVLAAWELTDVEMSVLRAHQQH